MLTVSKLAPGQEAYYEHSVAGGIDDYYAGRGESPGVWAGRGAERLGLEGVVGEGELGRLIRGQHPQGEERLRRHPPVRTITVERIDPETGERRGEQKQLRPVAGYDLVFSPPKSVSLLHALGDEQTRLAVSQAHEAAWQAALRYLEEEACVTRRGAQGTVREHGSGFVATAFQHRTNRAQEPHLHTHVVVGNLARSPDGRYRALDGEPILSAYRIAAGSLYQAQLRAELTRTLGVAWREPLKGMAEIQGMPEGVLAAFSTRRAQVLDYLELHGTEGFYARQVAALATRERKEEIDLPRLRLEWRARAAEHGLGQRELKGLLGRTRPRELDEGELRTVARTLFGPSGLTEKQASFSEPELVAALAGAQAGTAAAEVRAQARQLLAEGPVCAVGEPASPGRPAHFSSEELLALERRGLALLERAHGWEAPRIEQQDLDRLLRTRPGLSAEQRAMLGYVAGSPAGVVCVVGQAGAGKTTAARAVTQAFRAAGHPVLGAAPSGIAAQKLEQETGVPSSTMHRLLGQIRRVEHALPRGCLLLVDEAAMAETRVLVPVLEAVEQARGKAILIGDPAQLPAVGAGGLFRAALERLGAAELSENRRQHDRLEARALERLRAGEPGDLLAHTAARGRLLVAPDELGAKAQLLADWWQGAGDDLEGSVMIGLRRRDVAELNQGARALLERQGRLGPERLQAGGREFAAGDRVVCRRNDSNLGVRNGTRGTVASVDPERGSLLVEADGGDRVTIPARYLDAGHLGYGYALTGHATQGLTLTRAYVLARGQGQLKEWGYVALSRAQGETRVYIAAPELADEETGSAPLGERDGLTRLAQALGRSQDERLALEQPTDSPPPGPDGEQARRALAVRERLQQEERGRLREMRDAAQSRLTRAEEELAALGWLGRRRHGPALSVRISFERRVLEHAEERLARWERERSQTRERAPAVVGLERTRLRAHERALEREAPALEL
ncbi:MAG: MobF family relaxase [Gaiellaceae bacterium]